MAHPSIHEPFSRGPGPPWAASRPPPGPFEDGDDEYLAGGPDDLGDLILDMRDGGAWAEGLMDCGDGAPAQHNSQPPAADPMQTLLALSRRQQAQDLEQQAQAAPASLTAAVHQLETGSPHQANGMAQYMATSVTSLGGRTGALRTSQQRQAAAGRAGKGAGSKAAAVGAANRLRSSFLQRPLLSVEDLLYC
ncbi:hypothetical protein COHA_005925 [Chlorella ohadii]|uniref:Uncharacterized protein n=1 Tax=Chlorella ohadii TaxID=2649997 RepID=A0AAD5H5I6_9CHLO|nr:hypothetical protein COHA_005925 [Chlorella ohadii]